MQFRVKLIFDLELNMIVRIEHDSHNLDSSNSLDGVVTTPAVLQVQGTDLVPWT